MSFNQAQMEAINHFKGPALVLAGPGSGKTTVITNRVKKLIEDYHVPPQNILVITFTRMAANEMKTRFLRLSGQTANAVTFGTFHAVYFTMLKHAYHLKAENIIRQDQQISFIKDELNRYELEISDINEYAEQVLSEIGKVKNDRIQITEYHTSVCPEKIFGEIYTHLEQMMKKYRLIDFDDMLISCYELLERRPDLLEAWQNKYQYILIDEFQDICKAQYDVIRLVAGERQNIFIVGDDDQSIYGFRGAKPDIMLSFHQIFPNCNQINLSINYRSTQSIVACASSVIIHNKNRFQKDISTMNEMGDKVEVYEFANLDEENQYVIENLLQWKKSGGNYAQCAILTRTNAGGDSIMKCMVEHNIKFIAREVMKNIFSHWVALDLFCYIKVACGNHR